MLNFNLRHFRDLACDCIDYHCNYPAAQCSGCPFVTHCEQYSDLAKLVRNEPFHMTPRYYLSLATFVVKWAEATGLTNERGYLEAKQYLKEYGIHGLC